MKSHSLLNLTTSGMASLALIIGSGVVTATIVAPDFAYAKSDKSNGNGGGNDKSDRSNKGSNGNSQAGKSMGGSQELRGKVQKDNNKYWFARNARSVNKQGNNPNSPEGFGAAFKRDVKLIFSGDFSRPIRDKSAAKRQSVPQLERSVRPVARTGVSTQLPESKKHPSKWHRDPLIATITDPDGSGNLKNLNASKAASQAFQNASSNSNVGKIATYQEAAADYYELRGDLTDVLRELYKLDDSYDGRPSDEIIEDIAALNPDDTDYEDDRDALGEELRDANSYEEARMELTDDIKDLGGDTREALVSAESAFFDASKGRTLTRNALGEFHGNIGLPVPLDPHKDGPEVTPHVQEAALFSDAITGGTPDQQSRRSKWHRDPLIATITDPDGSGNLKNLNASKAASQAFRNASSNSNVGKIATYQESAADYYELRDDQKDALRELYKLDESYDGRTSDEIIEEIAALNSDDPDYSEELAELETELAEAEDFEDARSDLVDGIRDIRLDTFFAYKQAEQAFYLASKGEVLTPKALSEFHAFLGLPSPYPMSRQE